MFMAGMFVWTVLQRTPEFHLVSDPALPAECLAMATEVQNATQVRLDRKSSMAIFFDPGWNNPTGLPNSFSVTCPPWGRDRTDYSIDVHWEQGAAPPNAYYDTVGKSGQILTGDSPKLLNEAARRCHKKALKSKAEIASVLTPKSKIECQAFSRNQGAAGLSIWVRRVDDEED